MERTNKELVLSLGQYAYMQDTTSGAIKVHTGPCVINQSGQERPVIYEARLGFQEVDSILEAVRPSPIAVEGYYLELFNPVKGVTGSEVSEVQPDEGKAVTAPKLDIGRRVNIPGPVTFALWPGQKANYIPGHQLRSNQYLLIEVYNAEQATANWQDTVMKDSEGVDVTTKKAPKDLTVGKRLLIKGTDVSFYIPPTGIKVLKDEDDGNYLREALTLERMEYAILVDESGTKRFPQGPEVVFPEPTERIFKDDRGNPKFTALDLNELQGIHVKVISEYTDEATEETHEVGEELFITGKETQVYFPREEHALINYDGNKKHFATAIAKGDGRYLMNRMTGEIAIRRGETMCLPNPIDEVFVKRALTDVQSILWYPRSKSAQEYNKELRNLLRSAPTTRSGGVTEGEISRRGRAKKKRAAQGETINALYAQENEQTYNSPGTVKSHAFAMDTASLGDKVGTGVMADEISRASSYTEPRTLTMETKFSGVPVINLWPGYAVQVTNKTGERRVVQGPQTFLMEFDEDLEALSLSRGKPKGSNDMLDTVYLRVANNKVSDLIEVKTSDHVKVQILISMNVSFIGDDSKWFEIRDYTMYLAERVRSLLKGAVQKIEISKFNAASTDIVRNVILGDKNSETGKRELLTFEENGMQVQDVDVLEVTISDPSIASLVAQAQTQVVSSNIQLEHAKHEQGVATAKEDLKRKALDITARTEKHMAELRLASIDRDLEGVMKEIEANVLKTMEQQKIIETREANTDLEHTKGLARDKTAADQAGELAKAAQVLRINELEAGVKAMVERYKAVEPGFAAALTTLGNHENAVKVAQAMSAQTLLGGESVTDVISKIFEGTPFKERMLQVMQDATNGNAKQAQA